MRWLASGTLGNAKVASLKMKLKFKRWIFTRSAMGWPASCQVAKSNELGEHFEAAFAVGLGGRSAGSGL